MFRTTFLLLILSLSWILAAVVQPISNLAPPRSELPFQPNAVDYEVVTEDLYITASDGREGDGFGAAVSMWGDMALVAAIGDDLNVVNDDLGSVYLLNRNRGGLNAWGSVKKLSASVQSSDEQFGSWLSLSGDAALVGAPYGMSAAGQTGVAYIFERNLGGIDAWGQAARLEPETGEFDDQFGACLSLDGDTAAVGSFGANADLGAVYLYDRNQGGPGNWGLVKTISAPDGAAMDWFGGMLSLSGDTLAVGASGSDVSAGSPPTIRSSQGAVYIFQRNQGGANAWGLVKKLIASDGAEFDYFGISTSLSGDFLLVGASGDDILTKPDQGSAYLFERNKGGANAWGLVKKLTAPEGYVNEAFGSSVALSLFGFRGTRALVGAPNSPYENRGVAFVFERDFGGANTWGLEAKLYASDPSVNDRFGRVAAIYDDQVMVGMASRRVSGASSRGAVYLYLLGEQELKLYIPLVR
jgi:hypothetical protein